MAVAGRRVSSLVCCSPANEGGSGWCLHLPAFARTKPAVLTSFPWLTSYPLTHLLFRPRKRPRRSARRRNGAATAATAAAATAAAAVTARAVRVWRQHAASCPSMACPPSGGWVRGSRIGSSRSSRSGRSSVRGVAGKSERGGSGGGRAAPLHGSSSQSGGGAAGAGARHGGSSRSGTAAAALTIGGSAGGTSAPGQSGAAARAAAALHRPAAAGTTARRETLVACLLAWLLMCLLCAQMNARARAEEESRLDRKSS